MQPRVAAARNQTTNPIFVEDAALVGLDRKCRVDINSCFLCYGHAMMSMFIRRLPGSAEIPSRPAGIPIQSNFVCAHIAAFRNPSSKTIWTQHLHHRTPQVDTRLYVLSGLLLLAPDTQQSNERHNDSVTPSPATRNPTIQQSDNPNPKPQTPNPKQKPLTHQNWTVQSREERKLSSKPSFTVYRLSTTPPLHRST